MIGCKRGSFSLFIKKYQLLHLHLKKSAFVDIILCLLFMDMLNTFLIKKNNCDWWQKYFSKICTVGKKGRSY